MGPVGSGFQLRLSYLRGGRAAQEKAFVSLGSFSIIFALFVDQVQDGVLLLARRVVGDKVLAATLTVEAQRHTASDAHGLFSSK